MGAELAREQAERKRLAQQLEQMEVELSFCERSEAQLRDRVTQLEQQREQLDGQVQVLRAELAARNQELDLHLATIERHDGELRDRDEQLGLRSLELSREIERRKGLEAKLQREIERRGEFQQQASRRAAQLERSQGQRASQQRALRALTEQLDQLQQQRAVLELQLQAQGEQLELAERELQERICSHRDAERDLREQVGALESRLSKVTRKNALVIADLERQTERLRAHELDRASAAREIAELQRQLERDTSGAAHAQATLIGQIQQLEGALVRQQQKVTARDSQLRMLGMQLVQADQSAREQQMQAVRESARLEAELSELRGSVAVKLAEIVGGWLERWVPRSVERHIAVHRLTRTRGAVIEG